MCDELYKTSLICIDNYHDRILSGRICNAYLNAEVPFHSTMEFIREMDALLQELQFPQSTSANRVFLSAQEHRVKTYTATSANEVKGRLATFSLRIMFRQNSSWQGSLSWMEGNREESFRSVLELLLLIDNAIDRAVA